MSTLQPARGAIEPRRRGAWFADRSIRVKILGLTALFAVTAIALGVSSYTNMQDMASDTRGVDDVVSDLITPVTELDAQQIESQVITAQLAAADTDEARDGWLAEQKSIDAEVDASIAAIETTGGSRLEDWDLFTTKFAAWREARDSQLMPAALAGDRAAYEEILTTVTDPLKVAYDEVLDALVDESSAQARHLTTHVREQADAVLRQQIIMLVLALIVVTLAGTGLPRGSATPCARSSTRWTRSRSVT